MICAGIKNSSVVAVIQIDDETMYHQFSSFFDNLINTTPYSTVPLIGYGWTGTQFNWGQLSFSPSIKITRYAFRMRFTAQEKASLLGFGLNNITSANSTLQSEAGQILAMIEDQMAVSFVDLARQDTIAGVNQLAAMGFIASNRPAQILNTPPTQEEIYQG